MARHIQKHSRLIAVIESLDNGKSIRETRDADVLIVIRHLYYYAGWAELLDEQVGLHDNLGKANTRWARTYFCARDFQLKIA